MRVAERAGVRGPHVHPHTTRHTVAWTLCALGNTVEAVAGFVGHRNPRVTQDVYIAMTGAQRQQLLACPWLAAGDHGGGSGIRSGCDVGTPQPAAEQGLAMAEAICSPFGSADGQTFPCLQRDGGKPRAPTNRTRLRELVRQFMREDDADQSGGNPAYIG